MTDAQPRPLAPSPTSQPSIPVCRPLLPRADQLLAYLARIDASRHYTNHGQLVQELTQRLARHFGLAAENVVLAANGTLAITGALLAVAGRAGTARPLCVCPSYTFAATAIAAANCGFQPFLADVGADSWELSPQALLSLAELSRVGAVIAVGPYGRTPDIAAWERFSSATGIPVVIDAAACFDTLDRRQPASATVPLVVSLHATKTFSTAEGGMVLTRDAGIRHRTERALNFGFWDSRESVGPSTNGKLSEYHAAVGLADLDGWEAKRAGFIGAARGYADAAQRHGIAARLTANTMNANPYVLYRAVDAAAATAAQARLAAGGVDTRLWYGLGLHRQPEFSGCPRLDLTVTDDLAPCLIGLPCATDISDSDIERVVRILAQA